MPPDIKTLTGQTEEELIALRKSISDTADDGLWVLSLLSLARSELARGTDTTGAKRYAHLEKARQYINQASYWVSVGRNKQENAKHD